MAVWAALPRDLQERLLDVYLEAKPGALRIVCASGGPAADDVRSGRLLPDFDTTLAVFELRVPPLRERLEDLPRLLSRLTDRAVEPAAVQEALEWERGDLWLVRPDAHLVARTSSVEGLVAAARTLLCLDEPLDRRGPSGVAPGPPGGP